jgi:hypothetical protein
MIFHCHVWSPEGNFDLFWSCFNLLAMNQTEWFAIWGFLGIIPKLEFILGTTWLGFCFGSRSGFWSPILAVPREEYYDTHTSCTRSIKKKIKGELIPPGQAHNHYSTNINKLCYRMLYQGGLSQQSRSLPQPWLAYIAFNHVTTGTIACETLLA